jgi:methyl coenzyme M reductase subunit C
VNVSVMPENQFTTGDVVDKVRDVHRGGGAS